jgi:hypothetical protein
MVVLIICVTLLLIPGLPLTFTWLRFSQQRTFRDFRGLLTMEFPLFVVTGSYLLFFIFFGFVTLSLTFLTVHPRGDLHIHALVWSNVVTSFAMSVLALIGRIPCGGDWRDQPRRFPSLGLSLVSVSLPSSKRAGGSCEELLTERSPRPLCRAMLESAAK